MKIIKYINIANILTLSRILLGFLFLFLFIFIQNLNQQKILLILILQILSFFVVIIASITDGLDGYFARKKNEVTDFGKHFDPLSDSIFFIIVFIAFFYLGFMPWYFLLLIILRESFMHLFLRPFFKIKKSSLPANIYGKLKTVFQVIFILIITLAIIVFNFLKFISKEHNIIKNFLTFSNKYNKILHISSYILFLIIVCLSLFSITIYITQFIKFLHKNKD